jgi:hypothetical protein
MEIKTTMLKQAWLMQKNTGLHGRWEVGSSFALIVLDV